MAKVREAVPWEVERVLGMYEWLFAPPGSVPPRWDPERAREAIADAIADPSAAVLVAEHRGDLLGLCTAYLDMNSVRFGPRCWVEDLAVSPQHRSQGVGKALLDAAKGWARERGASHLELDSADPRVDAHRFYEREEPSWRSVCFAWEL
jgi:GNAT superfamily N-acetyltransferase